MKLGKEEIQKLALGLLIVAGSIYSYFDMLLFPELKKQKATKANIVAIGPQIESAKAQIKKTADLEQTVPEKIALVPQVRAMIPDGSPVAWFPTRLAELFKKQGIDKVATKLNAELAEKELTGFRRISWIVDFPKVDFVEYGKAMCALENEDPLVEIASILIETNRDAVDSQHVFLTLTSLAKQ